MKSRDYGAEEAEIWIVQMLLVFITHSIINFWNQRRVTLGDRIELRLRSEGSIPSSVADSCPELLVAHDPKARGEIGLFGQKTCINTVAQNSLSAPVALPDISANTLVRTIDLSSMQLIKAIPACWSSFDLIDQSLSLWIKVKYHLLTTQNFLRSRPSVSVKGVWMVVLLPHLSCVVQRCQSESVRGVPRQPYVIAEKVQGIPGKRACHSHMVQYRAAFCILH